MNNRLIAAVLIVASIMQVSAYADDQSNWLAARQTAFAHWRSAHLEIERQIPDLKAKTADALQNIPAVQQSDLDIAPILWRVAGAPTELWDDPVAPQLAVIPAGEFTMGSAAGAPTPGEPPPPRRRVRIGYSLAVAKHDVTVTEFAAFVAQTGYDAGNECVTYEDGKWDKRTGRNWRNTSLPQTPTDPVICLDMAAEDAYAAWLSKKTGHSYRLLSQAELEYANRAGTMTAYWWGDEVGNNRANCNGCGSQWDNKQTSPVGSFSPNPFGLFDTAGDVWSSTRDCWNDDYNNMPVDGSPDMTGTCDWRVLRGGSWGDRTANLKAAHRYRHKTTDRGVGDSFRLARLL